VSRPLPAEAAKRTRWRPASTRHTCSGCPWLAVNQGTRTAHGWYTKANLRRLWAGLRNGERMTCHPTDPANEPLPGQPAVPAGVATRECTGALVLVQRELQRLNDTCEAGGTFADYRRAHPKGLTFRGAMSWVGDVLIHLPGELEVAKPDLNLAGVVHPDLVPWVER
jgi:hypothetical protein